MKHYKTVAGPAGLTIKKGDSYSHAVSQYAAIIEREAVGGWTLEFIQEVPVHRNKGCLAAILAAVGLGTASETVRFNMLVFSKEE